MREQLLEDLNPLIADFIVKAKKGRFRDKDSAKLRISYANALSNLIRAYNSLLKDKEIEDIMQELQELKNAIAENQKGFE